MSRIGKIPIKLTQGITIEIKDKYIAVQGPKGKLEYTLHNLITIEKIDQELIIKRINDSKQAKKLHGLSRTIINNMIIGVSKGFKKILEIQGVGYRAQLDNSHNLILNVGYSHPVSIQATENIKIQVQNNNIIIVEGINKSIVGQIASNIRAIRPPEPYKGKGIRYQNEIVRKKVGKAGK